MLYFAVSQVFRRLEMGNGEPRRLRLSEESRASDGDSGVGAESNGKLVIVMAIYCVEIFDFSIYSALRRIPHTVG